MNSPLSTHLSESEIHMFARSPDDSALHAARRHLLECEECRKNVDRSCNTETLILENIELLSLESSASARPRSELKSQLHQLTHQFAMEDNLSSTGDRQFFSILVREIKSLFSVKTPVIAVPLTAAATFILAFIFLGTPSSQVPTVLAYQDSNALVFVKPSNPGLGFFHQAEKPSRIDQNFSGFTVTWDEQSSYIKIRWPNIDNATGYRVELLELSQNVSQQIEATNTHENQWKIKKSRVTPGTLYRLSLSGITHDNLQFHHSGGFILR